MGMTYHGNKNSEEVMAEGKYVSVRDYEVEKAIKKGGMRIKHGKDLMQLICCRIAKQLKPTGNLMQSKFQGSYRLVDITFRPLTEHPDHREIDIMGKRVGAACR